MIERLCVVVAGALMIAGCGDVRESLGLIHNPPDEFMVVSHEPLQIPETLDSLPEPHSGTSRPQETLPQDAAEELLGGATESTGATVAERHLMAAAGTSAAEPGIRSLVNAEHRAILDAVTWLDHLNIFRPPADRTEVLIDPEKESRRIQAVAALGMPINSGDFTESILEEQEKALLEGIF
ncbi:MAG: DUF3035 domain-containing protein [Alphaproteobacteria bacterium]|nr:DUF3035 domain-containing protein [Alphaproteobacteria bacterium]